MRLLSYRVIALAGCAAALTVAGCAGPPGPVCACPAVTTPQRLAATEAAFILTVFAPPPGASQVPDSPVAASSLSSSAGLPRPSDDDVVTKTSWWLAPGTPQQVLAWEAAHLPASYRLSVRGTAGAGSWEDDFSLPAVSGLFEERTLQVSTTSAGHGETAIRVDGVVDWISARPAGDTVPATARVATLTETGGNRAGTPASQTRTVTSQADVGKLAAYLNGLPVNVPGAVYNCPADFIGTVTVTFRASAGGPVLAEASGERAGCGFLSYSMPGKTSLYLGGPEAGGGLLAEVDHVTGLDWTA